VSVKVTNITRQRGAKLPHGIVRIVRASPATPADDSCLAYKQAHFQPLWSDTNRAIRQRLLHRTATKAFAGFGGGVRRILSCSITTPFFTGSSNFVELNLRPTAESVTRGE